MTTEDSIMAASDTRASSDKDDSNSNDVSNSSNYDPGVSMISDDPSELSNSRPEGTSESPEPPPSRGGLRSKNGKIASLRAAFERHGHNNGTPSPTRGSDGTPKRRFVSTERPGERIEEYENEVNRWKQELEKERQLRQALEDRCSMLEDDVEKLQERSQNGKEPALKDNSLLGERNNAMEEVKAAQREATFSKEQVTSATQEAAVAREEAASARQDAANAQRQLAELKRSISTNTRIENQVSDSTFLNDIEVLHHEVQNWIVNYFRRLQLNLTPDQLCNRIESIAEPKHVAPLKATYRSWDPSSRLSFFQATAVQYLMEIFDEPLLFGLPSQEWRRHLRKTHDALSDVLAPPAHNRWRATTLDLIRQIPHFPSSVENATAGLAQMISLTLGALTDVEHSEARTANLVAIVKKAANMSHTFRVQRAKYTFVLPTPGDDFDPELMDDVVEDGEDTSSRKVRCATFPAVVKVGDENGDSPNLRNVVAKAKVLTSIG